jgi:hypothetical protein
MAGVAKEWGEHWNPVMARKHIETGATGREENSTILNRGPQYVTLDKNGKRCDNGFQGWVRSAHVSEVEVSLSHETLEN